MSRAYTRQFRCGYKYLNKGPPTPSPFSPLRLLVQERARHPHYKLLRPRYLTHSSLLSNKHQSIMAEDVEKTFHNVSDGLHPASHQISDSTEGKHEWKQRPPYRVHEPNEHFVPRYEANCHCGRVEYQLSREEPLDSKLCHCTTCQTQHGTFVSSTTH